MTSDSIYRKDVALSQFIEASRRTTKPSSSAAKPPSTQARLSTTKLGGESTLNQARQAEGDAENHLGEHRQGVEFLPGSVKDSAQPRHPC
jgi:hypothetical protein